MSEGFAVYEVRDSESGSIDNENESAEVWNATKKFVIGKCPGGIIEVADRIAPYLPRYYSTRVGYWRRRSIAIKGLGNQCFECAGEYTTLLQATNGSDGSDQNGGQPTSGSIAWDTTGAVEHITSAREERVIAGDDSFEGAINIQGTSVQGVDIVVPSMRYSETWVVPATTAVSSEYCKSVYSLTGTVNDSVFRAFQPGEALFLGGRAQWSADQPFATITFDFQVRANDPEYYVKGLPTTNKLGWEYAWVVYKSDTTASGLLVQKPRCLVIDTVYKQRDWSGLQISAAPGRTPRSASPTNAEAAAATAAFFNG